MINAIKLPLSVPGIGMNGENAKDRITGVKVLLIRLVKPNKKPRNAPFLAQAG